MTKVWVHGCTRTREQEFIFKYFHFHLLSYRVDKTRFSSSGAARDCYVHLHVSPTFQFVLKKFLNVWNAILIYITLDVFVVNVLPCHVIHDEQRKIWTGKLVPATQLESVGVERITSLVRRPFHLISTHPPPAPLRKAMENYIFGGGRCVGAVDLWSIFKSRGMGKEPRSHQFRWGDWVSSFEGRGWEVLNSPELSKKVHSSSNLSKETFWPIRDHNRTRFTCTCG